jgi:hypothetical protein
MGRLGKLSTVKIQGHEPILYGTSLPLSRGGARFTLPDGYACLTSVRVGIHLAVGEQHFGSLGRESGWLKTQYARLLIAGKKNSQFVTEIYNAGFLLLDCFSAAIS